MKLLATVGQLLEAPLPTCRHPSSRSQRLRAYTSLAPAWSPARKLAYGPAHRSVRCPAQLGLHG
eukprot:11792024-Alexandrium_andersonii.AAC.1